MARRLVAPASLYPSVTLTPSQTVAMMELASFFSSMRTSHSLEGGAGVGKTWLCSNLIRSLLVAGRRVICAAPTHKACRVLRNKLDAAGIPWSFKPKKIEDVSPGRVVCDTTAALVGLRPVDQREEDKEEFAIVAQASKLGGYLQDQPRPVLIIDEASMLAAEGLEEIKATMAALGGQLLAVGDDGQLPPVKATRINFENDFEGRSVLTDIVRQAADSAIVQLSWAIRRGGEWEGFVNAGGKGLYPVRDGDVLAAYLDQVEEPVDEETRRAVFIAYLNRSVNLAQEAACQKVYGHSMLDFHAGQLVLASRSGYSESYGTWIGRDGRTRPSKFPRWDLVVSNADQLRVLDIAHEALADPVYGREVTLERIDLPANAAGRNFDSHYLPEAQIKNPAHPFNVRSSDLLKAAKLAQAAFDFEEDEDKKVALDKPRKDAWGQLNAHKQRVISFSHPFAITSHKAQGSTYRAVYMLAKELEKYNRAALYVGATRASESLYL